MARPVFVHGTFGGRWIWEPLAEWLTAARHIVEAPDLPGVGNSTPILGPAQLGNGRSAAAVVSPFMDRFYSAAQARP